MSPKDQLSQRDRLARLSGMDRNRQHLVLGTIVVLHLIVALVHGVAHSNASVPLSVSSLIFVIAVIQIAPLIGLAWMWRSQVIGARVIGMAMAASLLFGVVNHFIVVSPDHVDHVAAQWRPLFETTAFLLALTEAAGSIVGLGYRPVARRAV